MFFSESSLAQIIEEEKLAKIIPLFFENQFSYDQLRETPSNLYNVLNLQSEFLEQKRLISWGLNNIKVLFTLLKIVVNNFKQRIFLSLCYLNRF